MDMAGIIGQTRNAALQRQLYSLQSASSSNMNLSLASLTNQRSVAGRAGDWTPISPPQKETPGASKTVPFNQQRALKRVVYEAADNATAAHKSRAFDAGVIGRNSGRLVMIGDLAAKDKQDSYKITLNAAGKLNLYAPNPNYDPTKPGSKITLGDAKVEVFDPQGALLATSDMRDAKGFSNWIALSTEGLGGLQVAKGSYTVKITRDNPASKLAVGVNKLGQLGFDGTALDDSAKIGAKVTPGAPVVVTSSKGVKYSASFQLVKTAEGASDGWTLQLIGLTPVNPKDPQAKTPPTPSAPITLGDFTIATSGKPAATFKATDALIAFADGGAIAYDSSDILPGDMKLTVNGAANVKDDAKVGYSLFAVMGDPGPMTFYTVKAG